MVMMVVMMMQVIVITIRMQATIGDDLRCGIWFRLGDTNGSCCGCGTVDTGIADCRRCGRSWSYARRGRGGIDRRHDWSVNV